MSVTTLVTEDTRYTDVETIRYLRSIGEYPFSTRDGRRRFACMQQRKEGKPVRFGFLVALDGLFEPTIYLASLSDYKPRKFEIVERGMMTIMRLLPDHDMPHFELPKQRIEFSSVLDLIRAGWEID